MESNIPVVRSADDAAESHTQTGINFTAVLHASQSLVN